MNDFLKKRITGYENLVKKKDSGLINLRKEIAYHDSIETNLTVMLDQKGEQLKQEKSRVGWLKLSRGILFGVALILTGIVIAK